MQKKFINIGYGNLVSAEKIIAVISPESAPVKRMVQEARERSAVIDATYGRRTRSLIITDSHIILCAFLPERFANSPETAFYPAPSAKEGLSFAGDKGDT